MPETMTLLNVTPRERQLISALRDLPPSPLRDVLDDVLVRLVDFVREPHCPEMQADGVPCDSATADCEQCTKLRTILAKLANDLPVG